MGLSLKRVTHTRTPAVLVVVLMLLGWVPALAQQPQPQGQPEPPKQTDEFVPISQLPAQDQLPAAPLLVSAYSFVWIALFGYLVSLAQRLSKVQREVERLESDISKGPRT